MFDYCVSLGDVCSVAASMSKYGLRFFSGPFDWLVTNDFGWVLHYMETNFSDFLLQENLEVYDEEHNYFRDKKSGILFKHEVEILPTQFDELKKKYGRRIERFLEFYRKRGGGLYLRRIASEEEVKYIETHVDYINDIINRYNTNNKIVFICDKTFQIPKNFPFPYYRMKGNFEWLTKEHLRSYFDYADDFSAFCIENFSAEKMLKNLKFDGYKNNIEHRYKILVHKYEVLSHKYKTLSTLLNYDFSKNVFADEVIIYGAGVIGTELYKRIKNYVKVKCFVDELNAGGEIENVKIVSTDDLQYERDVKIIVSVTYDFENIKKELCNKYNSEDIISLDDILIRI